jgi:type I restriction enzyme R subunit
VILTTVHLFDGMPARITQQRPNVIVMADEAHRSQERELGTYMRSALEGASMFGFTGTPIENDDHNTPKAWGYVKEDGKIERYMGRPYTVTDALRDGVVKPIHWQPRVTDWQLHGTKLDVAFQREFGHLPEEERNKLSPKARGSTRCSTTTSASRRLPMTWPSTSPNTCSPTASRPCSCAGRRRPSSSTPMPFARDWAMSW